MAYLINIGVFPENTSGVGSRGYHVFRRGLIVVTVWGGIEVGPGRKFYWTQTTTHKKYRHHSERAAIARLRGIVERLTLCNGYTRLPAGAPIRRTAKSARSVRRR